jgi:metal-responsive CopG/Arc/MetJ family transcriptional regulator
MNYIPRNVYTVIVKVALPVVQSLDEIADSKNITRSELVRNILEEYVEANGGSTTNITDANAEVVAGQFSQKPER